ncbi:hypothetical protein OZX65_01070 [Leuconostocaceae bacterium ESL0723]|nr:hypothetical protein OZX65_01070 [Leuconostocaceae bacterium ESL0723]
MSSEHQRHENWFNMGPTYLAFVLAFLLLRSFEPEFNPIWQNAIDIITDLAPFGLAFLLVSVLFRRKTAELVHRQS